MTYPGTDGFYDTAVPGTLIDVGFQQVAAGTSVADWESSEAPYTRYPDCRETAPSQAVTLRGVEILLLPETCPVYYVLNAFLVHGTDGVLLQWASLNGHQAADRAAFLKILASLRFLGAS